MAKKRVPAKVEFVHALFEDFSPDEKFDYIFATYVLEHVSDAIGFLRRAGQLLAVERYALPRRAQRPSPLRASLPVIWDSWTIFSRSPQMTSTHGHRRVYDRISSESAGSCRWSSASLDKAGFYSSCWQISRRTK